MLEGTVFWPSVDESLSGSESLGFVIGLISLEDGWLGVSSDGTGRRVLLFLPEKHPASNP